MQRHPDPERSEGEGPTHPEFELGPARSLAALGMTRGAGSVPVTTDQTDSSAAGSSGSSAPSSASIFSLVPVPGAGT